MIDGNRLKFGFGDIAVGSEMLSRIIRFQQFKPHTKCGDEVSDDVEYIGEKIILKFSYEDYCEFCKNLVYVSNKEITEFVFKGYIFDFTNFNTESIKVCRIHAENAMCLYIMCLAA